MMTYHLQYQRKALWRDSQRYRCAISGFAKDCGLAFSVSVTK
jgi:hypothetical protein